MSSVPLIQSFELFLLGEKGAAFSFCSKNQTISILNICKTFRRLFTFASNSVVGRKEDKMQENSRHNYTIYTLIKATPNFLKKCILHPVRLRVKATHTPFVSFKLLNVYKKRWPVINS